MCPDWRFFAHQEELSRILHRKVDLNTPESVSKYFRDDVLREAVVVYAEAWSPRCCCGSLGQAAAGGSVK